MGAGVAGTSGRPPPPASSRAGILLLMVALSLLVIQSVRMGLGGLVVELAQTESDRWAASKRPQSMGELNRVAGYFADSLGYFPGNPWALEGLGRLDLDRMRISRLPDQALAFATDARKRYREALRQRPTSPFLWANLALAKLYLDEMDAEFFAALGHANELGPWEPGTQQVVLFAGLAAWDKLDAGLQGALSRAVERGGRRNASKIFEIVKSYRRFDLVCGVNGYDVVAGAECRKAAGPARVIIPKSKVKH